MSLDQQRIRPDEVVIVHRPPRTVIEPFLEGLALNVVMVQQTTGYFTHALNVGMHASSGDLVLFLDDDARAPPSWVMGYLEWFEASPSDVACYSSDVILVDPVTRKCLPSPDTRAHVALYRRLIRPLSHPPLEMLRAYAHGIYLDKRLRGASGTYVPGKTCRSLPYRGTNMGFLKNGTEDAEFPEHQDLKRGFGNEQFIGLQLVLDDFAVVYSPGNPVVHINHGSTSRGVSAGERRREGKVLRYLMAELLRTRGLKS